LSRENHARAGKRGKVNNIKGSSYVWGTKKEKTKREQFSVRKFKNVSKVTVLFTSVAGPELPCVRRLRNVHSSGSLDESLTKGYALAFFILGDHDIN
jgi:hypothetical protein